MGGLLFFNSDDGLVVEIPSSFVSPQRPGHSFLGDVAYFGDSVVPAEEPVDVGRSAGLMLSQKGLVPLSPRVEEGIHFLHDGSLPRVRVFSFHVEQRLIVYLQPVENLFAVVVVDQGVFSRSQHQRRTAYRVHARQNLQLFYLQVALRLQGRLDYQEHSLDQQLRN